MAAVYAGPTNTYVPSHNATNKMVVDFARNVKDFPINKYTQIVPVDQNTGFYLLMTLEEAARILQSDGRNFLWPDGAEAPLGYNGSESFEYKEYRTIRRALPVTFGKLTVDQASWDIVAQHARIKAAQCMTLRTQMAITALTTAGNYAADHTVDVSAIAGNSGRWDQSTTARNDIKRSITHACEKILDSTLGALNLNDLQLVINSALAAKLAVTQEITDYIKGSPAALDQVRGDLGQNSMYGLPDKLYGVPLVVEDTRKLTSKKGATRAVSQVLAVSTPFIAARPGELEGVADAPNFSTCVGFVKEEMTVETLNDVNNRRVTGRITDDYVYKMVAPASGFLFTGAAA